VRLHDWFNLAVLAVLNAENFFYLLTGRGFNVFYTSAMVYFLLDTVFVGVFPQSVKSPVVILAHHICTSLYMLIPYHYPRYQWCMAHCMLVEVNTWLLIARRTIGGKAVELGFYVSWVALRNLYYPYLIWAFYHEWQAETVLSGTAWNPILITPIMQAFLTGLNYHWTAQLVAKLVWPKQGGGVKGVQGGQGMQGGGQKQLQQSGGGGKAAGKGAAARPASSGGGGSVEEEKRRAQQRDRQLRQRGGLSQGGKAQLLTSADGEAYAGHL
jgi:hypothetical protein